MSDIEAAKAECKAGKGEWRTTAVYRRFYPPIIATVSEGSKNE